MSPRDLLGLLRDAVLAFNQDRAPRLGAALAFYAISSIGPLLVLLVAIAGFFLRDQNVQQELLDSLQGSLGDKVNLAEVVGPLIESSARSGTNVVSSIVGTVVLFFTATGLFIQLQDALNSLWGADPAPVTGFWKIVRARLVSFVLVLVFVLLIVAFLVANTVLSGFAASLSAAIGGGAFWLRAGTFLLSVAFFTPLFAVVYRYLPDVRLSWRDVRVGAVVTAFLFALGQVLLGFYFGRFGASSVPGAVGSLVALLAWLYYSAQILFFGAEVTWVYSQKHGSRAGGAQSPGKKAALVVKGADLDPTPSAAEQEAMRRTPGVPNPVASPGGAGSAPSGPASPVFVGSASRAPRPASALPGTGQVLGRIVLAVLALPALPVVWLIRRFSRR